VHTLAQGHVNGQESFAVYTHNLSVEEVEILLLGKKIILVGYSQSVMFRYHEDSEGRIRRIRRSFVMIRKQHVKNDVMIEAKSNDVTANELL